MTIFPFRRTHRLLGAALAGLTAASVLAAAPAARQALPPVPLVGSTTVSAPAGVHGIVFSVPDGASLHPDDDVTIDEFDGEFARVLSHSQDRDPVGDCINRFCDVLGFVVVPDWFGHNDHAEWSEEAYNNGFLGGYGCEIDGQDRCPIGVETIEFYIAADAPITFTMEIPELSGSASYEAAGVVDGELLELPTVDCPGGDCDRWEIGHAVREAGTDDRPGKVAGFAYARTSYEATSEGVPASATGVISANGCSYPSVFVPSGSADPAEHPLGCEFTPTVTEQGDVEFDDRWIHTTENGLRPVPAVGFFFGSGDVNGEAYAGFHLRNHQALPGYEGSQNAWAVWVTQGVFAPTTDG